MKRSHSSSKPSNPKRHKDDKITESANPGSLSIMKRFRENVAKMLPNAHKGYIKNSYHLESFLTRHNVHLKGKRLPKDVTKFDESFHKNLSIIMKRALTVNRKILRRIDEAEFGGRLSLTREEGLCLISISFLCGFDRASDNDDNDSRSQVMNLEGLLCLANDKLRNERLSAVSRALTSASNASGMLHFERKSTKTDDWPDGDRLSGIVAENSHLRSSVAEKILLPVDSALSNPLNTKARTEVAQMYQDFPELLLAHVIFKSLKPDEVIVIEGCRNFSAPPEENSKEVVFFLTVKTQLHFKNSCLTVASLVDGFSALKDLAHSVAEMGISRLESSANFQHVKLKNDKNDFWENKMFCHLQTLLLLAAFGSSDCHLTIHTEGNLKLASELNQLMNAINENVNIKKPSLWLLHTLSNIKMTKGNELGKNLIAIVSKTLNSEMSEIQSGDKF